MNDYSDATAFWYLLLHIAVPDGRARQAVRRHFRVVQKLLNNAGITVRPLWLLRKLGGSKTGDCRYLFRFNQFQRDDQLATRLAESFVYAVALVFTPLVPPDEEVLAFPVPDSIVRKKEGVTIDDLLNLEESRSPEERTLDYPNIALGRYAGTAKETHEAAWKVVPAVFRNQRLFEALRFLKASKDDFEVSPGDLRDVLQEGEKPPMTTLTQTRFENALQNAFKSIEAIIGDPPKDDKKFYIKIRDVGLDPLEQVGYGEKMPLCEAIRQASRARDSKSAHGSTKKREIAVRELLNHQSCAACVVWAAVEKELGEPIFPERDEKEETR